jgi:hypothetical protein
VAVEAVGAMRRLVEVAGVAARREAAVEAAEAVEAVAVLRLLLSRHRSLWRSSICV